VGDFINEVSGLPRCVKVVRVFHDSEMLAAMAGVKGGCDRNVAGQGVVVVLCGDGDVIA